MSDEIPLLLRRTFTAAAVLLAVGAIVAIVVLIRHAPSGDAGLGESFRYDISSLRKVDPALIIADEVDGFMVGVVHPTVLAQGPSNTLCVGGNGEIETFGLDGVRKSVIKVGGQVTAMAVDGNAGRFIIALGDRIESFEVTGESVAKWQGLNSNSVYTAIVPLAGSVFVADAGNRLVLRYGADGSILSRFGDKSSEYHEGFVVPSPYFPMVAAPDDTLWVVDPGRHRFINVTRDGHIRSRWEKSGMAIDGFCGCCNPTHIALRDDGSFVTAEKGLVRVKVHAPDGTLVGVVAAPDKFGSDTRGLSLVVDEKGRVLVLDPEKEKVRVFVVRNGGK